MLPPIGTPERERLDRDEQFYFTAKYIVVMLTIGIISKIIFG